MHQFAQLGVSLSGRAASDREHAFDISIEQAFAQYALPDHSGSAEKEYIHQFSFSHRLHLLKAFVHKLNGHRSFAHG